MKTRKLWTTIGIGAATFGIAVALAFAQTGTPTPPPNTPAAQAAPMGMHWGWGPGAPGEVPPNAENWQGPPPWRGGRGMMGRRFGPRGRAGWGGMMGGPGMMGGRAGWGHGPGMMGGRAGWGGMMGGRAGWGHGPGMMGARGGMMAIPALFANTDKIERTVTLIEDGVVTVTESDDPQVAALLQRHVGGMAARLEAGYPVRLWDPLFADLYRYRDEIETTVEKTEKGVRVTLKGTTPEAVALVRAHAKTVDKFLENGWAEMHTPHASPLRDAERPTE